MQDSGCASTQNPNRSGGTTSPCPTCNQCNRPKIQTTIQENMSVCVNQCSQIQINIQLTPCQSNCANSNCNNQSAGGHEGSGVVTTATRGGRQHETRGEETDDVMSVSESEQDDVCANRSEDEADGDDQTREFNEGAFDEDEDWPEEAALLASMASEASGSQVDLADMQTQRVKAEPNVPMIKSEMVDRGSIFSHSTRPQLSRPSYRDSNIDNSNPRIKTEITSDTDSQQSNFEKFLAPVKRTFTQTSLGSFLGLNSTSSSATTQPAQGTIKKETSSQSSSASWQNLFRGGAGSKPRTDGGRGGGWSSASSSDAGGDARRGGYYGRQKKPCPFYKKMPGK